MAKKNKKKLISGKKRHKSNKHKHHSASHAPKSSKQHDKNLEISKALIISGEVLKDSSTTFSKKLEEVINQAEEVNKKGLFSRRIILLNAPLGYSREEWKKYLRSFKKGIIKFLIIISILAAFVGAVIVIELIADQKVLPQISLSGQSYNFMSKEQAGEILKKQLSEYNTSSFNFTYQGKTIQIPFSELGIKYEYDQTLNQIPFFNFKENHFVDLIWSGFHPKDLPLIYSANQDEIYHLVEARLNLQEKRARNAQFYFDENKKLTILPEQDGLMINQEDFNLNLQKSLKQYSPYLTVYTIEEKAKVKTDDLNKFKDELQLKIESPLSLKFNQNSWKLLLKNHLEDINFDKVNDQVLIRVKPSIITNFLQKEVFDKFEIPVSDLKINYDEKTSKVSFDGLAKNGFKVDHDKFIDDLNLAVNSLDPDLDIPTQTIKANLDIAKPLQDLGIKELISTGHTAFSGSPVNRRFNIKVGMSKFNGVIIKPGETFSFDDILGPVEGSTGYKLELVIKAEGTVPEFGGGVCQVSSTMFKAALLAGFPIVERSPHSYAVGYYAQIDGYGLDSTIYPGVRDLKFINDSGQSVLIQTFVDGDDAYINLFGTNDGREVKLENYWRGNFRSAGGTELIPTSTLPAGEKKQIESAHGGFDASWDRVVYRNGKEERRDKISSAYRATSNRILVGQ